MCRPIEILTAEEVKRLLRACSARASTGLRNRALIVLGWRAGLRLSEALALRTRDLDPEAGTLNVRRGKGGKQRLVGLDPTAFAVIELWLVRRRELGVAGHLPLICTLAGGSVWTSYVRSLMPRLGRRAGIDKRVHFHGLRHAHAAELARERVPMHQIQAQLGHENLATTDVYLRRVAPQELIEAVRARRWCLEAA